MKLALFEGASLKIRSTSILNILQFQSRDRRFLWITFIFAIIALLTILGRLRTGVQPGVSHDDAEYIVLAESFATGRPYRLINYPDAPLEKVWPPGYPLLILTIPWLLFGPSMVVPQILNILMLLISAIIGYLLLRTYLDQYMALSATFLFVMNHKMLGLVTITMSETAFTCFLLLYLYTFVRWDAGDLKQGWGLFWIILLLSSTILIRYWAVPFLGAAVIYLIFKKEVKWAFILGTGVVLILAIFPLFLLIQSDGTSGQYLAVELIGQDIASHLNNLRISIMTYSKAAPLLLIPILGPSATAWLDNLGLGWSVSIIHMIILLLVLLGFALSFIKQRFLSFSVACYVVFFLIFTQRQSLETEVFNEPRVLVPILIFLYSYLLLGIDVFVSHILMSSNRNLVMVGVFIFLAITLLIRNFQQARVEFPVADLSTGADWAQSNTEKQSIFMAPDPVSRYIHLRRFTIDYPVQDDGEGFLQSLSEKAPNYLMIAPPLRIDGFANLERKMDPWDQDLLLPLIEQNPDCFLKVFEDLDEKTYIYEVISACQLLAENG